MATQSLHADDMPRPVLPDSGGRALKYQLNVLAIDAAEVVRTVGGWLFDRSMAGWEVNVSLADPRCDQSLRILGAHTGDLSCAVLDESAAGMAVSATLLSGDRRLTDLVAQITRVGRTEVAVWGGAGLTGTVDRVHYRLSAAARIFKRYALDAAGQPDAAIDDVETLFRGGCRPVDSDLLPVD